MRITGVKKEKDQTAVVLEDGSKLNLPLVIQDEDILIDGEEMSNKGINSTVNTEYLKIKDCALRLLGRRAHSVSELRTKLIKRDFHQQLIEQVLEELLNSNLLNDRNFAEEFFNYKITRKSDGLIKIVHQLKQRGIDNSIINEVVNSLNDDETHFQNALKLANHKLQTIKRNTDNKIKIIAKLNRYLLNKGFSSDIVRKVTKWIKL